MSVDAIIDGIIDREGKYVNHPSDPGGETNWGITIGTARANGYTGNMREMSRDAAKDIYHRKYIVQPGFQKILTIYPKLAEELIDTGVNMGPAVASMFLQQSLNVLNGRGKFYSDIKEDGDIGAGTIAALIGYKNKRGVEGEDVLRKACDCLQGAKYIMLGARKESNEAFMYGWLCTRIG